MTGWRQIETDARDVADVHRNMEIEEERNSDVTALSPDMFVEHCKQLTLAEVRRALENRGGKEKGHHCIPSIVSFVVHAQEKLDKCLANIRDDAEKLMLQEEHATKIFDRVCWGLSVASLLDSFRFGSIYFHPEQRPHQVLERFWIMAMSIFLDAYQIL